TDGYENAAAFERKQRVIPMLLAGQGRPFLRRSIPAVQILLRRQNQGALPISHDLNRCFASEIFRKPTLPSRFRDPLHQALAERRDPKMAATVLEAGDWRKAIIAGAVVKLDGGIQATDGLAEKPELAVPAHHERTGAACLAAPLALQFGDQPAV